MIVIHTYGYRWMHDHYYAFNEEALKVKGLFKEYLRVKRQKEAANNVGLKRGRNQLHKMLTNKTYLGDELHPQIIDEDTFNRVQDLLKRRAIETSGRNKDKNLNPARQNLSKIKYKLEPEPYEIDDPFSKASYLYTQIKEVKQ